MPRPVSETDNCQVAGVWLAFTVITPFLGVNFRALESKLLTILAPIQAAMFHHLAMAIIQVITQ